MLAMSRDKTVEPLRPLTLENKHCMEYKVHFGALMLGDFIQLMPWRYFELLLQNGVDTIIYS